MLIPKANDLYVSVVSVGLGYLWVLWVCSTLGHGASDACRGAFWWSRAEGTRWWHAGGNLFFHPAPQGRALEQRDNPEGVCGLHQEDAEGLAEVTRPGESLAASGDDK